MRRGVNHGITIAEVGFYRALCPLLSLLVCLGVQLRHVSAVLHREPTPAMIVLWVAPRQLIRPTYS